MNRGQIYLLRLDPTEASEQAGTRPVVIISRNAINKHSPVVVVCPITDAVHVPKPYPSDVFVKAPEGGLIKDSVILTLQIRAVSKNRFLHFLGDLKPETIQHLEKALKITLNLS